MVPGLHQRLHDIVTVTVPWNSIEFWAVVRSSATRMIKCGEIIAGQANGRVRSQAMCNSFSDLATAHSATHAFTRSFTHSLTHYSLTHRIPTHYTLTTSEMSTSTSTSTFTRAKDGGIEAPMSLGGLFDDDDSSQDGDEDGDEDKKGFQQEYSEQAVQLCEQEMVIRQYCWHMANANKGE
jgi:hypothetical protein